MENKLKNNFVEGLIWNYGSVVILSASGFLLNFLIVYFYDAAALGVFNRAYAWYCVFSQIAVWGVHMSVMKLIPEHKEDAGERELIMSSALIGVFLFSAVCVVLIEAVLPWVVTANSRLLASMQVVMPGLVFFSLNKVLINYLNGLSDMKAFSFFRSLRYIVIIITIFVLGTLQYDSTWLSFSFTEAEMVVFVCCVVYLVHKKLFIKKPSLKYVREHFRFGTFILMSNLVTEINTKVDIICLGFMVGDDYLIGIYSFAVLFTEGFYQLYFVVRRSINPKITECYVGGEFQKGIEQISGKLKKYLRVLSPLALGMLIAGYCVLCFFLQQEEYLVGLKFLIIICLAIMVTGRKIIFGNLFAQTGLPLRESVVNTITVVSNFTLNIVFIYFMGLSGAAVATAASYLIFGYALWYYAKKELHVTI